MTPNHKKHGPGKKRGTFNIVDPYNTTFQVTIITSTPRPDTSTVKHIINIPQAIVRALELKKGDKINIKLYINKEIVISKQ
jgi:hypothetical protein